MVAPTPEKMGLRSGISACVVRAGLGWASGP